MCLAPSQIFQWARKEFFLITMGDVLCSLINSKTLLYGIEVAPPYFLKIPMRYRLSIALSKTCWMCQIIQFPVTTFPSSWTPTLTVMKYEWAKKSWESNDITKNGKLRVWAVRLWTNMYIPRAKRRSPCAVPVWQSAIALAIEQKSILELLMGEGGCCEVCTPLEMCSVYCEYLCCSAV